MFAKLVKDIQNFISDSFPTDCHTLTFKEEVLGLKVYGSYPLEAVLICFEVAKPKLVYVSHAVSISITYWDFLRSDFSNHYLTIPKVVKNTGKKDLRLITMIRNANSF